jgi:putative DNA primase/helicase
MRLQDLLGKLSHVRKTASGYVALCPAHDDKKQSLSVTEKDGKILLHCHAGCSFDSILTASGTSKTAISNFAGNGQKARIVAQYDYTDEKGNLLFQAVRLEPKDFRQRKPDGKGGWQWQLNGTRRVLYHLPEVIAAQQSGLPIFICEGEKDVDSIRKHLDFVATTNPQGALKWRDEYSDLLFGCDCIILPDNDLTGEKHAEQVARSLYSKANSVRIVKLPNLPPKGDVSDWIQAGGTREKLIEIADSTPEYIADEKNENDSGTNFKSLFTVQTADARAWLKRSKDLYRKCFLVSFGTKARFAFCLPILIWAKVFWLFRLRTASATENS